MFSGSDAVNYGSGGWGQCSFWTFWSRDILALVSNLLERLKTHLSFSLSSSGSLEATIVFEVLHFVSFFTWLALVVFDWFGQVANSVYVTGPWLCIVLLVTWLMLVSSMWHVYWHASPIDSCQVILASAIYMTFERHICYWYIFCSSLVKQCCRLVLFDLCVQYCGIYVDYSRSTVGHIFAMWQTYLFRGIFQ